MIYGNQNEIADGIEKSGVPREEAFLVSKLWNNSHRPEHVEADLDTTLSQLRTSYLDAWLIHWPVPFKPGDDLQPAEADGKSRAIDKDAPGIATTWKEVVRIWKETKKVKSIGVSNFNIEQLETIINATGVVPVMNQIECHPNLIQPELFDYCKKKGIVITAYSPLGNNITGKKRVIDEPEIVQISERLGKSPAQVLIAWVAHQGFCVIPKSVTPSRIAVSMHDLGCSTSDLSPTLKTLSSARRTFRRSARLARRTPPVQTFLPSTNLPSGPSTCLEPLRKSPMSRFGRQYMHELKAGGSTVGTKLVNMQRLSVTTSVRLSDTTPQEAHKPSMETLNASKIPHVHLLADTQQ